jgi:hypothetical protein
MFLDLKGVVEESFSLLSSDGHMHGDLLISLDGETSDSVSGLGFNWLLTSKILQDLCGLGELISRLTGTEIENEFLDFDLSHFVVELFLLLLTFHIFTKTANLLMIN